jgi:hypothetical protein
MHATDLTTPREGAATMPSLPSLPKPPDKPTLREGVRAPWRPPTKA